MKRSPRLIPIVLFVLGAMLFVYIVMRAACVSFTHDEAFTTLNYVSQSWEKISDVKYTNNHLLNSLGARACYLLFGPSELSLRLPNVLGGLLFIIFAIKLLRRLFGDTRLAVVAFIVVCCNGFMIEFFSLCRGYGISIGLLMGSLYFLFRHLQDPKNVLPGVAVLLLCGMAVLANYTLAPLFFMLIAVFLFYEVRQVFRLRKISMSQMRIRIIFLALTVGGIFLYVRFLLVMLLSLEASGNFDFGGSDGFWGTTVRTLAELSCIGLWLMFYDFFLDWFPWLVRVITAVLFAIAFIVSAIRFFRNSRDPRSIFLFGIGLLMVGCASSIWLQHFLFKIPFSVDRTALYFIPLFSLLCTVLLPRKKAEGWLIIPFAVLFILPVFSFLSSLNLSHSVMWRANASEKEAALLLNSEMQKDRLAGRSPVVSMDYDYLPVYNYYCWALGLQPANTMLHEESGVRAGSDYFYGEVSPGDGCESIWNFGRYHVWKYASGFKDEEIINLPAREQLEYPAGSGKFICSPFGHPQGIMPVQHTLHDTIPAGAWLRLSCELRAEKLPVEGFTAISIMRGGAMHFWYGLPTSWVLHKEGGWQQLNADLILREALAPGEEILIHYSYNDSNQLRLRNFSARISRRIPDIK
jgi:4-amino-4-deoxy-L-arabinose transferase-like glycosyltransferase